MKTIFAFPIQATTNGSYGLHVDDSHDRAGPGLLLKTCH
jgi:hypothetical protein